MDHSFGLAVSSPVFPAACELFEFRHGGNRLMAEYNEKTINGRSLAKMNGPPTMQMRSTLRTYRMLDTGSGHAKCLENRRKFPPEGTVCHCAAPRGCIFFPLETKNTKSKKIARPSPLSHATRGAQSPRTHKKMEESGTHALVVQRGPLLLQRSKFFPAHVRTEHHDRHQQQRTKSLR
jgi:hypothetical protein